MVLETKRLLLREMNPDDYQAGRRPVLAFGNSSGDVSMLNYTICDNTYKSLAFMLIADDDVRDYGVAGEELRERWEESGYHVISMEKDWQTIYGEGVVKTGSFHWVEDLAEEAKGHF